MYNSGLLAQFPGFAAARCPQDLITFFDDFIGYTAGATTVTTWLSTAAGAGSSAVTTTMTAATPATAGGILTLTPGTTAADTLTLQVEHSCFHISDGYPLFMEARFAIPTPGGTNPEEVTFIGLATLDTTPLDATDKLGWDYPLTTTTMSTLNFTSKNTSGTKTIDTLITESDGLWIRARLYWDGENTITCWIDDNDSGDFKLVGQVKQDVTADYVPTAGNALTPTIAIKNGATAGTGTWLVDYIFVAQQRYKA